jgi:hypothetical protein
MSAADLGAAAFDTLLDTFHICGVNVSFTLFNIEVYTLTFLQPTVVFTFNSAVVYKNNAAFIIINESVSLLIIEPLYCSL